MEPTVTLDEALKNVEMAADAILLDKKNRQVMDRSVALLKEVVSKVKKPNLEVVDGAKS